MSHGQLLFLCTGNYYRSRTAEEYFNHLAATAGLGWRATSRGLFQNMSKSRNVGPLSAYAIAWLEANNVPIVGSERMPQTVTATDFAAADRVVCLDETEHRPMMARYFYDLVDQVDYWNVQDLAFESAHSALSNLAAQVHDLVAELTIRTQPA